MHGSDAAWRWFRDDLGSPQFICAPMVRQSELAFRLLTRHLGCQLTFTPMFVASAIVDAAAIAGEGEDISFQFFDTDPKDRPLIVQLCGNDPDIVARAVTLVQHRCDGVDLNLGCPQRCALQGNFGSYLLDDPELIERIVRAMVAVSKVPITCKIRIQEDISKSISLAKRLEAASCSMLTVHGRLRSQRHHEGCCNWDAIREIRQSISIPVIANGGIESLEDAKACLQATGCHGVMSATALLKNPAIFQPNSTDSIFDTASQYLDLVRQYPPLHPESARDHILTMVRSLCQQQFIELWSVFQHQKVLLPDQLEACLAHLAARTNHSIPSKYASQLPALKDIILNWASEEQEYDQSLEGMDWADY